MPMAESRLTNIPLPKAVHRTSNLGDRVAFCTNSHAAKSTSGADSQLGASMRCESPHRAPRVSRRKSHVRNKCVPFHTALR